MPPGWDPSRFSVDEANVVIVVLSKEKEALQRIAEEGAVDPSSMLGQTMRRASPRAQVVLLGSVSQARKEHVEPTDAERADALRSWVTLIGMLAEGALPLTQAGYLKPDAVGAIVDEPGTWTHRKSCREMDIEPVRALHESLKTMAFARHYRGEFVLTKGGEAAAKAIPAGELEQLERDVAAALVPAKESEFERCARTLYALLIASAFPQEHMYEMIRELIADVGRACPTARPRIGGTSARSCSPACACSSMSNAPGAGCHRGRTTRPLPAPWRPMRWRNWQTLEERSATRADGWRPARREEREVDEWTSQGSMGTALTTSAGSGVGTR